MIQPIMPLHVARASAGVKTGRVAGVTHKV